MYCKSRKCRPSLSLHNVPLVAFSKNGQNWTFGLKRGVFNNFNVYFQQYECLLISPIAFMITLRQIQFFFLNNFDLTVKEAAERGPVFSKYRVFEYFGDPKIN